MSGFEQKYGGSETYTKYQKLVPKFTDEFQKLTFELMVEMYVRYEMNRSLLSDRDFQNLGMTWAHVANELGVLRYYPYNMNLFPHAHPMTRDAAIEGKKRLGIT